MSVFQQPAKQGGKMQQYLKDLLTNARVFDLGMPYFTGMPHHPNQPSFAYTLTKKHGDITLTEERVSFCNDLFVALPLKIKGGAGSPVRPIAVV
jgi:kynurenine formamidase